MSNHKPINCPKCDGDGYTEKWNEDQSGVIEEACDCSCHVDQQIELTQVRLGNTPTHQSPQGDHTTPTDSWLDIVLLELYEWGNDNGAGITNDRAELVKLAKAQIVAKMEEASKLDQRYLYDWIGHSQKMRRTLIINRNDSKCGNCQGSCNPDEKRHDTKLGYGDTNGEPGCRAYWQYVSSEYTGMEERLKEMRPDLEWLDYYATYSIAVLGQEDKS